MQGSFFSNAAVFFLLFLIARTWTRLPCACRFSHGQSHTGIQYCTGSGCIQNHTRVFRVAPVNLVIVQCIFDLKRFESSCEVMNVLHKLFYPRVFESFESHAHASHVTLPLGSTVAEHVKRSLEEMLLTFKLFLFKIHWHYFCHVYMCGVHNYIV